MAIQENARFQEITQARLTVTSQGSSEGLTKPDQTPVENILNRVSFVRRRRITKQLAREIDDNGDSKAGAVIATLFNSSSTKDYKRKLDTKAIAPEEAVDIFQQPVVPHLVQLLANEPRRPDFQLVKNS